MKKPVFETKIGPTTYRISKVGKIYRLQAESDHTDESSAFRAFGQVLKGSQKDWSFPIRQTRKNKK